MKWKFFIEILIPLNLTGLWDLVLFFFVDTLKIKLLNRLIKTEAKY